MESLFNWWVVLLVLCVSFVLLYRFAWGSYSANKEVCFFVAGLVMFLMGAALWTSNMCDMKVNQEIVLDYLSEQEGWNRDEVDAWNYRNCRLFYCKQSDLPEDVNERLGDWLLFKDERRY